MTDLDVALRLSLINQMRSGAEAAKRDLEGIRAAAERAGKGQSSGAIRAVQTARQLERVEARKTAAVARTSVAYRRQRSELLAGSMAAEHVARRQEVRRAREEARIRREARSMQAAMAATAATARKIEWAPAPDIQLKPRTPRGGAGMVTAAVAAERARLAAEAKAARDGAEKARKDKKRGGGQDAANRAMAAGVGVGFARTFLGGLAAGMGAAGIAEVVRRTVAAAAEDEFERSQLRVSGNLTQEQMEEHRKLLERTARLRGVGTEGSYSTFGTLMDSGWSDKDAAAMTDSVIVFAKANRVATEEATELTSALRNNMKVSSAKEMMTAYDAISRGAKSGKMSAQDLARYLPGVLGGMQRLGEQGQTGVRNTVALLETVSMRLDSSREAAAGFEAVLGKLANPAFIKRAGKLGVNVEKTMRDANKKGVSPLFAVLKEIDRRTKGDPIKLGKLGFSKNEIAFLNAALKLIDETKDKIDDMAKSGGETMKNYKVATDNATEAWKRLSATIGQDAKDLATDVLPGLTRAMDTFTQQLERARTQKAGGEYEAPEDATDEEKAWVEKEKAKAKAIDRALGHYGRTDDVPEDVRKWVDDQREKAKAIDRDWQHRFNQRAGGDYEAPADAPEEVKSWVEREKGKAAAIDRWVRRFFGTEADPSRNSSSRQPLRPDGTPIPTPAPRGDRDIPIPTPAPREWQKIQDMLKGMDKKASDAGQATMDAYKAAMGAGLDATRAIVADAVAQMREMLNFSASPTIVPHVAAAAVAAGGGGGGAPAPGGRGGGGVTVTQHISSPNSRVAAARAMREHNRTVRMAKADALHDTGLA